MHNKNHKRSLLNIAVRFLKHFIAGKSQHGVHSPFVYRLISECIYSKERSDEHKSIRVEYNKLKNDKTLIKVIDYGSGFQLNNDQTYYRPISDIAKRSLKSSAEAEMLYRFAKYFQCVDILELGTCFGITTSYLSKASLNSRINTIEGCPQIAKVAQQVFKSLNVSNAVIHIGNIDELLLNVLSSINKPDLIFIDAGHTQQTTIRYFDIMRDFIKEETIIIIDDIHRSSGMNKAWDEICGDPDVTVSIDLFFMGVVFFRKNLSKENFKIKPINLLRDIFH